MALHMLRNGDIITVIKFYNSISITIPICKLTFVYYIKILKKQEKEAST